jgi:hypothetical protein
MVHEGQSDLASVIVDLYQAIFDHIASVLHLFVHLEPSVMFSMRILLPKYCTKLLRIAVGLKLLVEVDKYPVVFT